MPFNPIIRTRDREIYKNLPGNYSDFKSVDFLTDSARLVEYWELVLMQFKYCTNLLLESSGDLSKLEDFQINALAPYFGFTERFFNEVWSKESKVCLFKGVYNEPYIWKFRGSEAVLHYVLKCFGIDGLISKREGFIVGISTAGDVIGSPAYNEYDLVLPVEITPGSTEYQTVIWAIENFTPFWTTITIVYR